MKKETAEKIKKNVAETYETIAASFSDTRKFFWTDVAFLFDSIQDGQEILDAGCGNGRLLGYLKQSKNITYTGVDISEKLLDIAKDIYADDIRNKSAKFMKADIASLPFKDKKFDVVVSLAVLHHIPLNEARMKFFNEIHRVLKPGGKVIITVWNLWQKKYRGYVISEMVKKLMQRSEMDLFDCYIPWKRNGAALNRYCHAFTPLSLKRLAHSAGFESIAAGYSQKGHLKPNLYLTAYRGS